MGDCGAVQVSLPITGDSVTGYIFMDCGFIEATGDDTTSVYGKD